MDGSRYYAFIIPVQSVTEIDFKLRSKSLRASPMIALAAKLIMLKFWLIKATLRIFKGAWKRRLVPLSDKSLGWRSRCHVACNNRSLFLQDESAAWNYSFPMLRQKINRYRINYIPSPLGQNRLVPLFDMADVPYVLGSGHPWALGEPSIRTICRSVSLP